MGRTRSVAPGTDSPASNPPLERIPTAVVRALKQAYGNRLVIAYVAVVRVVGDEHTDALEERLLDACRAESVTCVSLRRDMLAARTRGIIGRGFPTTTLGSGHLNAEGHRLVATAVWPYVRERFTATHGAEISGDVVRLLGVRRLFAATLVGLRVMPTRESRQLLLLVANVIFYGSGTPWHLVVLGVPAIIDYAAARRIEAATDARIRKQWLRFSVACNLGLLGYFKYADFFVDTIAHLLGTSTIPLDIALPVGISFFTFKTMSYTIDVYRGELPACRSLWRYAMFVSFFPELVAGPIVRASIFLPQMDRPLTPRRGRALIGLQIALLGIAKKLLIADRLALFADSVFDSPGAYSQATVIAGVVAYSLQIYCDFSGYSDIAIGVARIIGFDLPRTSTCRISRRRSRSSGAAGT